jgi:maltose O-acetyltransferase
MWGVLAGALQRMRGAFWAVVYRAYRGRYQIDPAFRFNGCGIQLYGDGRIELGADSYIGELSTIQSSQGHRVRIGRACRLSHNVRIYTETSDADSDFRGGAGTVKRADVDIGDGAWIGVNVFIGPGATIGANSIVGANSVVTRDIPPDEIWAGVPARHIRAKRSGATT